MLELHIERFGGLDLYRIKDSESTFSASFLPDAGGILNDFTADVNGKTIAVIEGYADAKELLGTYATAFKSAKLSPYPNRILNGQYTFNGKTYLFDKKFGTENNSIHGLVYNKPFFVEKTECAGERAELVFSYKYRKEEEGYSFAYKLTVKYILHKNRLSCETKIENTDSGTIPIGDGWHPYFKLSKKIDELQLLLPACELLSARELIPTGASEPYTNFSSFRKIGDTHFDSCFYVNEGSMPGEIKLLDAENKTVLTYWQEQGTNKYRYFQLYTPPSRKSIAIEPMSCPPNAFNSKKDLILLEPKEQAILSWGFEIGAL